LKEEHKFQVFQNKKLWIINESKWEKVNTNGMHNKMNPLG
jgi:hypothetical protein